MQMRQSNWLNNALVYEWLEISRFSEVLKEDLELLLDNSIHFFMIFTKPGWIFALDFYG